MNNKQMVNPVATVDSNFNVRPALLNTEQKIFQEIVNLLLEINEIKESIKKEKEVTLQMEN
jgi:hypothetical protein